MKRVVMLFAALSLVAAAAAAAPTKKAKDKDAEKPDASKSDVFKPEASSSQGSVSVAGRRIDYQAVAGTLVVHPTGWDDAAKKADTGDDDKSKSDTAAKDDTNPTAEASMFYVAYFKRGVPPGSRPLTFLFNGGPGSSTMWLHMGAFGPRRIVTANDTHTPAAPYRLINNDASLLDASDLVFIDAPGTGFSRVEGKDGAKSFYGVDQDGYAFSEFVSEFLSKYGRWNSPKYLFGESYGTPRASVMINQLETERDIDFNGVILLSQILSFDMSADGPETNPGVDLPYELALPTYAATAWYHHKLAGNPPDLQAFLDEVEHFALTDYALALEQGAQLPDSQRDAIAAKLHDYTGLPVDYILKANLRINGGEFEKTLQDDEGLTTGRLDSRFSGPTIDPLSEAADYDPQSAAISSAYVSAFNDYVRKDLHFGQDRIFKPENYEDVGAHWELKHKPPGASFAIPTAPNVMPDLASAMKYNPNLKILLNGGYFDLATPFFEGIYEMHHLQIPQKLQSNIEYKYYQSGHMVYANETSLKQLHDTVASFIRRTDNVK